MGRAIELLFHFNSCDRQPPVWLPVSSVSVVNWVGGHTTQVSGEKSMRAKNVKQTFDKARVAASKAVAKLPEASTRGFHDGRKAGHDFVANTPYFAGAVVGFAVGAGEAVVDLAASAIGWAWAGEDEGASSLRCGE